MEEDFYNFKELDHLLRDIISISKGQVDFLCMGGMDELSPSEKEEFYTRMQGNMEQLYESMNYNLVVKAKNLNQLMQEIIRTRKELEIERNGLKKRNIIIEQDLLLARKIQRQLIPLNNGNINLGMLYKPMDKLGGDFFDIIHFRESTAIGFFMCDVSGHGIPASLVTTIIKSQLMQVLSIINSPAEILSHLNQVLINVIAGNFVTAFMGIIDLKNGILTYSNAGHNPPVIINENGVQYIRQTGKGIPLAIMNNSELISTGRNYCNESFSITPGSKLLLYTDGLTEATPAGTQKERNVPDFETVKFEPVLNQYKHLPSQDFIEKIYEELISFMKTEVLEDDVCMICYEYSG